MLHPALFLLLIIFWAMCSLWWFHMNFRIVFSISVKIAIRILIVIALNLYMALGYMDILVHEHEILSHLFVSPLISVISIL